MHLPPPRVALDLEVDEAEVVAIQDDHARAGAEDRPAELGNRAIEPVEAHQSHERRGLAARDHEPVEPLELLRLAHLDGIRAQAPQHRRVLAEVALHGQNADRHAEKRSRRYSGSAGGRRRASHSPIRIRTSP